MSEPLHFPSRATRVTFFEDRASVEREATISIPAGACTVLIDGIGAMIDDDSLLAATTTDGARIIAARVIRARRQESPVGESELQSRTKRVDDLRAEIARAQRALARAEARVSRTELLGSTLMRTAASAPRGGAQAAADLDHAYRALEGEVTSALDQAGQHRTEVKERAVELAQAEARLREAELLVSRHVARLELAIDAPRAGDVRVTCSYRIPCALWRPEHRANLEKAAISLKSAAVVWQATGEEWSGVTCRFSTARPSRAAECPLIEDDVLRTRRRAEPRAQVVVEAREQTIARARSGSAHVDEMPGVDDGGEPAWLDGRHPCDIPSDGCPVRVELAEREIACRVDRVSYPEISAAVHVRARATLDGASPILAGPVVVQRDGEVVGRTRISFVAPGDAFELGFGVDDGLRVRRSVETKRRTQAVTGTQIVKREVTLYGSNMGARKVTVRVVERVPVSEVEAVRIEIDRLPPGGRVDDDGLVTVEVELKPADPLRVSLDWTLEAGSQVVLPPSL